ncbi:hypothetical protein FRB99_000342 [Tulasnella sp. 403]|nr:hypothetical protein FRB99_000342 [Tulasnella sp. 403]
MLLSKNVRRDPTLISMIVSWIIFTIIMCLLYYAGYQTGPEPPFGLCLAQASLAYGAPVMACAAGLGLVIQVFFGLRNLTAKMAVRGKITARDERDYQYRSRWRTRAVRNIISFFALQPSSRKIIAQLVTLPYVLLVTFSVASAIVGLHHRNGVSRSRSFFFCSIESNLFIIVSWCSAVLSGVTVIFEAWIVYIFCQNWSEITLPKTETAFNVRIIIRVIAFSVYSGLCWLSFLISGTKLDIVPWVLTACVPLVAFFIFGTQMSILRVWAFWIPRKPRPELDVQDEQDSKDLYTLNFGPVTVSKAALVPLPPRAHMTAAFINDEDMGRRNCSRHSLFRLDVESCNHSLGGADTINTLSPLTFRMSYTGSPSSLDRDRDLYGWERGAAAAGGLSPSIMSNISQHHLDVEFSLLEGKWRSSIPNKHTDANPVLQIARDVTEGKFAEVLHHKLTQPLFAIRDLSVVDEDGNLGSQLQSAYKAPPEVGDIEEELLRLAVGVACVHAFVQVNWTGPDLSTTPASVLKAHNSSLANLSDTALHSQAIAQLAFGGEPAYHLAKHPTFLQFASEIFNQPFPHLYSAGWWRLRVMNVHEQVLDEPAGLDPSFFSTLDELRPALNLNLDADLDGRLVLERGLLHHIFAHDKIAAEDFVEAAKTMGLEYELSGALGKRTKFQLNNLSQLVVLAKSRKRDGEDPTETSGNKESAPPQSTSNSAPVPETLPLNDDTLLEQTQFTSTAVKSSQSTLAVLDPSNQPALHPLDQCVLLALCLNVKNTSPSHGLTKEQMAPYVSRVISHPQNWSIHTMALLLRSRLEADRTRTVERSTLQLQALIDQMPTSDSTVEERLRYFHSTLLPSKWEMEKELALRFLSLGVVRSALEIFERLEMWEHVVKCWQAMERSDKGIAIVTELLEGTREEAERVIARGKSSLSEKQRPAMDDARTAKLWCLLGDLEPDKAADHYQRAWELSKHKSGRAMRSLGGYHFARGNYAEAVPYLRQAAEINPLMSRTWFLLGCSCVRLEKWEEARDAFARCVAIDDEDGESWNNLASVYLRMGEAVGKSEQDQEDGEDDETLVNEESFIPQTVPFGNKLLAFRALKQGLKYRYENWQMWSNYMIVAVDVGELSEACRAFTRVVEERATKDGDKCVDYDVLDRLVDAVTRADDGDMDDEAQAANPNTGKQLAPRVSDLFSRTLLPRFSSARIFRACARFLVWQSAWGLALEAYMNAYRVSVVNDEAVVSDLKRFQEAVTEVEEMVEVMRNLGPRAAAEGNRHESESVLEEGERRRRPASSWQFQARGLVRTFMGRTRETFEDEPEWQKLEALMKELKS